MKPIALLLFAVAAYEAAVGLSELFWVGTASAGLAKIAALPSVASVADTEIASFTPNNAHYVEGAIDLAIAAVAATFAMKQ